MLAQTFAISALFGLAAAPVAHEAPRICQVWSTPERIGELDFKTINEASGLAVSRQNPDLLYHVNDSGDGPNLFTTRLDGTGTTVFTINNFKPYDVEALSTGPCINTDKTCIYIGDIGDNKEARDAIEIVVLPEPLNTDNKARSGTHLLAHYPGGAHNAEGMAVHPNGDIYILTKEEIFREQKVFPAHIYRLPSAQFTNATTAPVELEHIATIDIPALLSDYDWYGQIPTGFDISADGKRFLILTYQAAIEVGFDLAAPLPPTTIWQRGMDYSVTKTATLIQQEAISYSAQGDAILYDTEYIEEVGEAPIYQQTCQDK